MKGLKGLIPLLDLWEELSLEFGIVLDKPLVPVARQLTMRLAHHAVIERHALANLDALGPGRQAEVLFGQQIARPEDGHRDDVAPQLFGKMESTPAELVHLEIFRAGALGEDEHRIAALHDLADVRQHLFHRHRGREEIGKTHHMAVDLAIPHPLSCHHNQPVGEHQRSR